MLVALYATFVLAGVAVVVTAYAVLSAADGHEDRRGFHRKPSRGTGVRSRL